MHRYISIGLPLLKLYLLLGRERSLLYLKIEFMDKVKYLKKLGAHIAKVRKQRGYSQDRIYLEGGFSRGTLSKIENGLTSPELYTLVRIAAVLDVPVRKLIDFD